MNKTLHSSESFISVWSAAPWLRRTEKQKVPGNYLEVLAIIPDFYLHIPNTSKAQHFISDNPDRFVYIGLHFCTLDAPLQQHARVYQPAATHQ